MLCVLFCLGSCFGIKSCSQQKARPADLHTIDIASHYMRDQAGRLGMPVHLNWSNDHRTILRVSFDGEWALGDLLDRLDGMMQLVEASPITIALILDYTDNHHFPPNIIAGFSKIAESAVLNHPSVDYIVVVGAREINDVFLHHFSAVYHELEFAESYDQAYEMIRWARSGGNQV
jgi:hypothetical protein